MTKFTKTKKLSELLEFILEIFYFFAIVVGYNIIRLVINGEFSPENFYNRIGYATFVCFFIIVLLLLVVAEGIKMYIKHTEDKIYYSVNYKIILSVAIPVILIFELFLIK
jgi:hypothetical protein